MSGRRVTQSTFAFLALRLHRRMEQAFFSYAGGKINLEKLHERLHTALDNGHARAAYMGRWRAGDTSAFDEDDKAYGAHAADTEETWLEPFMEDIRVGKYGMTTDSLNMDALSLRSSYYARKLRGTANEAFAAASDPDAMIHWRLEGENEEHHCETCPYLASHGPYRASEMPTYPGLGDTDCLTSCTCFLERADGIGGFQVVTF